MNGRELSYHVTKIAYVGQQGNVYVKRKSTIPSTVNTFSETLWPLSLVIERMMDKKLVAYLELNYLLTSTLQMPQFVPGLYRKVAWLKNFRVFCSVIDQTYPTVKWYATWQSIIMC